jgi:hypothetical protein
MNNYNSGFDYTFTPKWGGASHKLIVTVREAANYSAQDRFDKIGEVLAAYIFLMEDIYCGKRTATFNVDLWHSSENQVTPCEEPLITVWCISGLSVKEVRNVSGKLTLTDRCNTQNALDLFWDSFDWHVALTNPDGLSSTTEYYSKKWSVGSKSNQYEDINVQKPETANCLTAEDAMSSDEGSTLICNVRGVAKTLNGKFFILRMLTREGNWSNSVYMAVETDRAEFAQYKNAVNGTRVDVDIAVSAKRTHEAPYLQYVGIIDNQ